MDSLNPHSCSHCQNIIIDGTGPAVEWTFKYTFDYVAACAIECAFFRWTQRFTSTALEGTDELTLSISQDSEDLAYLNATWREKNGRSVHGGVIAQSELYIFTREGKSP